MDFSNEGYRSGCLSPLSVEHDELLLTVMVRDNKEFGNSTPWLFGITAELYEPINMLQEGNMKMIIVMIS